MEIESGPKFNPAESPESQEIKPPENVAETTPVSATPEDTNTGEADITARQEADVEKLTKLREQLGVESKVQSELEQKTVVKSTDAAGEVIEQQKLTGFEKWIKKIGEQDKVGSGAQKRIYIHPDNPQKIVGVFHADQSIYSVKERFYINKILNLLYPDNIPDIHLAASQPSVLVIDRIMGKEINPWNLKHQLLKILIRRRLQKIGILIDDNSCNFMADQDGKVFYIDGFIGNFRWNKEKLLKKIDKLHSEEKRRALSYLGRIEILENQSKALK